jgi:hypothetical protein
VFDLRETSFWNVAMIEPLNFCRQLVKQFTAAMQDKTMSGTSRQKLSHYVDLAQCSRKFILPDGGRILNDPEYRALDESQLLRLPYPFIALEYNRPDLGQEIVGEEQCSKSIVFARERSDEFIAFTTAFWSDRHRMWLPTFDFNIPRIGYLSRDVVINGYLGVKFIAAENIPPGIPPSDFVDEIGALMMFLNALGCSNVRADKIHRKTPKKLKGALPFDEYNILTIDCPGSGSQSVGDQHGQQRHPREHLRRGHIRKLQDGRRLWINATVVNAGKGGKISKDYAIRDPRIAAMN